MLSENLSIKYIKKISNYKLLKIMSHDFMLTATRFQILFFVSGERLTKATN